MQSSLGEASPHNSSVSVVFDDEITREAVEITRLNISDSSSVNSDLKKYQDKLLALLLIG